MSEKGTTPDLTGNKLSKAGALVAHALIQKLNPAGTGYGLPPDFLLVTPPIGELYASARHFLATQTENKDETLT